MTEPNESNDAIRISVQDGAIFIAQFDRGLSEEDTILLYPSQVEAMLAALLAAKLQASAQLLMDVCGSERFLKTEHWFCITCEKNMEFQTHKICGCAAEDAVDCILIDRDIKLTPEQAVGYQRLGAASLARSLDLLDGFLKYASPSS